MAYPVTIVLEPLRENRNRLTVGVRPILALPHALLVGPFWFRRYGGAGLLGSAAFLLAIVNWFTILLNGTDLDGIRQFQLYYLRWRVRAIAYMALFVDQYPPFGDAPHPATVTIETPQIRDRTSVALRLLLAIPHFIVLSFVLLAWLVVTVVAWFVIVFTGRYPAGMEPFALGAMRWMLRVEAYLLLLVDDYPPFSLE
jgi:hypothetical protein